MFKTILVPTDGSDLSRKAVRTAVEFARQHGSKLIMISVAEPYPLLAVGEGAFIENTELYEKQMAQYAQQHVGEAADIAAAAQVPCETIVAFSMHPYEEIIKAANERGCDAIFMASHGRSGLGRIFLGSETQKVLTHSTIPVLVLR
jgi:nucleotide-binding universal stress UspA family protein